MKKETDYNIFSRQSSINPRCHIFIARKHDGLPLGYAMVTQQEDKTNRCLVNRLLVRPECRKMGIGMMLMNAVVESVRQTDGVDHLYLWTGPKMGQGNIVYEKMGFKTRGCATDWYGPGDHSYLCCMRIRK